MTILDFPIFSRIRRNHGLEHATLNLLARRFPGRRMAGISHPGGFLLAGELPTDGVREAVFQALARMGNGERQLAIHANCGTNFAASGFIAGLLAWLGMLGARSKREQLERLPLVITLATLGFIAGQPLGPLLQKRITTSGDPQGMVIEDISPMQVGGFRLHRVVTRG